MTTKFKALHAAVGVLFSAMTIASCAHAQSRGELLYLTQCISCQKSEIH